MSSAKVEKGGSIIGGHNLRKRPNQEHYKNEVDTSDEEDSGSGIEDDSSSDTEMQSPPQGDAPKKHQTVTNSSADKPILRTRRHNPSDIPDKNTPSSVYAADTRPVRQNSSGAARWVIITLVAFIVASPLVLRNVNMSSQCNNGLSVAAQDLRRELNEGADFPPSFDIQEFIAVFKHRVVGRPTVIHLVSTSEQLPIRTVRWLHQKQPCSGELLISGQLPTFIAKSGSFAKKYESVRTEIGSCHVFFTVILKNAEIDKTNRDWLESVIDDTRPFAYLPQHSGPNTVDTNDWCVILLDHWTEALAGEQIKTWSELAPAIVQQRIRDITAPMWTSRFYQRIQAIFFL